MRIQYRHSLQAGSEETTLRLGCQPIRDDLRLNCQPIRDDLRLGCQPIRDDLRLGYQPIRDDLRLGCQPIRDGIPEGCAVHQFHPAPETGHENLMGSARRLTEGGKNI
jgi:hypothetical protein